MNSLPSLQRANGETEKKHTFSAVEDSTLLQWHSGKQKRVGRTKQKDQIDNEIRLFWKSIVKTKHLSLTSLASIRLVPGADRVVHHICIRCIDVCLFEVVMNHCFGKLTHADICQRRGDFTADFSVVYRPGFLKHDSPVHDSPVVIRPRGYHSSTNFVNDEILRTFAPKNFPRTDFFKTLTAGRK